MCSVARERSASATAPHRPPPGSAKPASRPSTADTPTAVAAAPPSCSPGSAKPQPHHLGLAPETLAELVLAQVRLLRTLLVTIADLDRALARAALPRQGQAADAHARIGEVNLAQIIAEVGPILDRATTVEQAIGECGAAPGTRASGKTRTVGFRWPPTGEHEPHCTPSPTTPETPHPGPPSCMPTPADAASTTPRQPHPRPRLAPGHVGLLEHQHHLQPHQAPRRTTPRRLNLTQETQALRRPRGLRSAPPDR